VDAGRVVSGYAVTGGGGMRCAFPSYPLLAPALRCGHGDATAQDASRGGQRVRPAGQDDRHLRAQHDPRAVGARHKTETFRQDVAGHEVGHHEHVRVSDDRVDDVLDCRRVEVDRVVERQRAVRRRSSDLAAIRRPALRGDLDRRGQLRIHRLHC
jgi:hypothetical protein